MTVNAKFIEGGMVMLLVPLFAWWFKVSLLQAFLMDLGLLLLPGLHLRLQLGV